MRSGYGGFVHHLVEINGWGAWCEMADERLINLLGFLYYSMSDERKLAFEVLYGIFSLEELEGAVEQIVEG